MNSRLRPTATTSAKAKIDLLGLTDFLNRPGTRKLYDQASQAPSYHRKRPLRFLSMAFIYAGDDLLSHTLSRAVQSALRGLTSVFGMGTGGTPAVRSPTKRSRQHSAVSSFHADRDYRGAAIF